jgi:hypothetical protein
LRGSDDWWSPHGGERGEGLAGLGWLGGGLGRLAPGCGPSGLLVLPFYFFIFVFFFFCFRNLFWVLKGLLYLDLNKSQADHFWSLESVFTTYKPEV